MSSIWGTLFRIATWGESHGGAVGVVVDGCPARLPLAEEDIQPQLDRRRPGQSKLTSPRQEADRVRILSGVFEGRTLGSPILLLVENTDARPGAYEPLRELYRPSHADFTYDAKFGFRNWQGGGRASARETVGRVAAGAIAEKILRLAEGIEIVAYVRRIGGIEAEIPDPLLGGDAGRTGDAGRAAGSESAKMPVDPLRLTRAQVDATPVRCPDADSAAKMIAAIDQARKEGDSLGGVIEAVIRGVPAGLGSPVFDKLEADLAKAMLSLPACKGFESGSGFAGTRLRGSEHNDPFIARERESTGTGEAETALGNAAPIVPPTAPAGIPRIGTRTNRSGGIQGGISNGEPIVLRAAFKPTATIRKPQETVDVRGRPAILEAQGRHDPCVLPRAVPLVEAMAALVLVDHWMQQLALDEAVRRIER
jgi:chorismate synthase